MLNAIAMPTKKKPTPCPKINFNVDLKPWIVPWAAQRIVFGPGDQHIKNMNPIVIPSSDNSKRDPSKRIQSV